MDLMEQWELAEQLQTDNSDDEKVYRACQHLMDKLDEEAEFLRRNAEVVA